MYLGELNAVLLFSFRTEANPMDWAQCTNRTEVSSLATSKKERPRAMAPLSSLMGRIITASSTTIRLKLVKEFRGSMNHNS